MIEAISLDIKNATDIDHDVKQVKHIILAGSNDARVCKFASLQ